jgi:probable HAF family extracellular repeat protein
MLHSRRYRLCCVVAVLTLLPVGETAFTAADSYAVVEVATLGEVGGGRVRGLNAAGEVVGTVRSQSGKRGFRLGVFESPDSPTRSERLDGFFGADASAANAINPQGAVAGGSNTATGIRAFLWTRNGGFRDLGTLPGDAGSEALGINRHEEVVGYSSGPNGIEAVLWESNGTIQRLGQLRFGDYSRAYAINDSADIVGTSEQAGSSRAFLWTRNGQMEDLGALPGNDQSVATGINNSGRVVGYSSSGSQGDRAFLRALAINEPGDVVGVSDSAVGNRAVLWTRQGELLDLNTLIPPGSDFVLTEAVSINNQGQILATGETGQAVSKQGHDHSRNEAPTRVFLLVP